MPVKMKTSDLEGTLPGWLRDARKASGEKAAVAPKADKPVEPPVPAQPVSKNLPASPVDFLAGLSQVGDEEEETPDWLKSLQNSMPAPIESAPPAPEELADAQKTPAEEQEPVPAENEWGFGGEATIFKFDESEESASQASQDLPDWMNTLNAQEEAPQPGPLNPLPVAQPLGDPAIFEDLPDWLAALTDGNSSTAGAQPVSEPVKQQDDNPDWLSSLGGDFTPEDNPPAPEADAAENPDWLVRAGQEPAAAPETGTQPVEQTGQSDQPDWLMQLSNSAPAVEPSAPVVENAGSLPNWMTDLQEPDQITNPPETLIGGKSLAAEPIPDWIAGLSEEPADSQPAKKIDTEIPAWLAQAVDEQPAQESPANSRPFDTGSLDEINRIDGSGELPAWMASLGQTVSESGQPTAPQTPLSPAPIAQPGADLPGWLDSLPAIENRKPAGAASASDSVAEPGATETLAKKMPTPSPAAPSAEDQTIDSILSMDMPDWLSGFTGPEKEQKTAQSDEALVRDANLLPAELPSWVQAMRPMESVMAGTRDSRDEHEVEDNGPFAGLRSILPVQPGLAETHKSKTYSIKLLASETQQAQAQLLENLLKSESEPQQVSEPVKALIRQPLRWLIAAVLLLAAILPAALGTKIFPSPVLPAEPGALGMFIQSVAKLPDNAAVLVVVDYQPGYAAELEAAAGPVMTQLMSKNARLAFISTSPVGPFMADRLLQKFTAVYPYQVGTQYVNLGYLPGGAGGIKVFAEMPRSTVGQDSLLGNMWDSPALADVTINNVTRLANFAAVFVLTDNPDTGRLWIEQAHPAMQTTPLLMVVSAQAEPMVRPYILSGQVDGILSGLEGGAIYENALGKDGQAQINWDAFGVVMLAAELIIIMGGVWGLVASLRSRRAVAKQDEA
jgi:hypothetical protein